MRQGVPKIITKLGLDQTRFILRFKNIGTHTQAHENAYDALIYKGVWEHVHACTHDLKPGAKHWKTKKGAMTKSVYPLDGGSLLTVALGWSTQGECHFMTVQFNPSKLTDISAIELNATFECMFDWGYEEFFDRAECSYVEIALDVLGANMTDYLFFDTQLKSVNDYYQADGTLYLGSQTSSRYVAVYDKAKEVADKGGPVIEDDWLRIEPRLKPKVSATDIVDLPCAFATVWVIDKQKLAGIKYNSAVNVFRNRVLKDGVQPQAAFLLAPDKKGLLSALQPSIPDWYNPIAIWGTFPAAAFRVGPVGVQAIAESPHPTTLIQPEVEDVVEPQCA
jgi:hypothetical protein